MCRKLHFVKRLRCYSSKSLINNKNFKLLSADNSINNRNSYFCSYLAGLIEGDGTIIVPKLERSLKGKLYYPSIQIEFHLRDFPLAQFIQ
jgi:hypothetical protein